MNAELAKGDDDVYVAPALSARRSLGPRLQHRADDVGKMAKNNVCRVDNDLRIEPLNVGYQILSWHYH